MKIAMYLIMSLSNFTPSDFACLADNVYYEARNQPVEGMQAVATITVNRVEDSRFPADICSVVHQKKQKKRRVVCQFSWVCQKNLASKNSNAIQRRAWAQATVISVATILGYKNEKVAGSSFYHADYVNPTWNRGMSVVAVIGDHIFFRG